MSCCIRELGGANARPNAEALGEKPIKKKPVALGSAVCQIENTDVIVLCASRGPSQEGPVIGLGKGAPPPACDGTPNQKHDDGPNGRANQTRPLARVIPAESLS
jgi:hypothetical protein